MEELRKGPWSEEEDRLLSLYVEKYGAKNWGSIQSKSLLKRTGKSCEFRWRNRLRPGIRNDKFTQEEERLLVSLQKQYGNKWAKIASYFSGRTDNQIKNFWNNRHKKMARAKEAMSEITNNHMPNDNNLPEKVNSGTSVGPSSQTEPNNVCESPCNNLSHGLSKDDFIFDVALHNNVIPDVLKELANTGASTVLSVPKNTIIGGETSCDNTFLGLSIDDFMLDDDIFAAVVEEPQATAVSSVSQLGVPGPLHKPPSDDLVIHDDSAVASEAKSRDNINPFDPSSSLWDSALSPLPYDLLYGDQFLSLPSDEEDLKLWGDGSDGLF